MSKRQHSDHTHQKRPRKQQVFWKDRIAVHVLLLIWGTKIVKSFVVVVVDRPPSVERILPIFTHSIRRHFAFTSSDRVRIHHCSAAATGTQDSHPDFSSHLDDNIDDDEFESETPSTQIRVSPVDRFHADMKRVLESRQSQLDLSESTLDNDSLTNRRNRPPVLTSDIDGAERVLAMLQHMVLLGVANEESYAIVMQAFLRRGRCRWKSPQNEKQIICAADQLESLLEQLEELHDNRPLSTSTYNLVLEAYANCATPRGDRDYAAKAQQLLEHMDSHDLATVESLVHGVHAWSWQQANMQPGYCAKRANKLLDMIVDETDDVDVLLQCHDWVLEAWSKSGSEGSAEKADYHFRRMKELNEAILASQAEPTGDNITTSLVLPNAQSYTNVVLAWSKSHDERSGRDNALAAAQRAHDLLMEMIDAFKAGTFTDGSEPELIAFNGVITAWARLGRPDKGEQVLWIMDELRPLCRALVPDVKTYNSVLHAHVKSPNKIKALEKAISLVQRMEDTCHEQPAIKPDSFTYNTLMKAWIQSGHDDFAPEVERILLKMQGMWETGDESVRPTTRNFNVVLNAYAKSNDRVLAAKKAHDLLLQMKKSITCPPDIISYTTVIECYSKSGNPNASIVAEELFQQAFDAYEQRKQRQQHQQRLTSTATPATPATDTNAASSTNRTVPTASWKDDPYQQMPNLRTFTMVILALSKCPRPGNAVRARALLTQLIHLYQHETQRDSRFRPNQYPFNYVLNCAANTNTHNDEDKLKAFQVATQTFQEMKQLNVLPDSFTYAFWIKACNNLLPPNSDLHAKCVSFAFEQCKEEGLVTNEVLTRLQQGANSELLQRLFELDKAERNNINNNNQPSRHPPKRVMVGYLQIDDLPLAWSERTRTSTRKPTMMR